MAQIATFDVAYSQGRHTITVGETVRLCGVDWRIGEPVGRMYSPAGLGGTLTFRCYPLVDILPAHLQKHVEDDGGIDFCGDSIAAQLARGNPPWE